MYDCDKDCPRKGSVACSVCPCKEPRGNRRSFDWMSDIDSGEPSKVVEVQFKNTRSAFFTNPERLPLKEGDIVAVEASPGHDIGRVSLTGPLAEHRLRKHPPKKESELKKVFRLAHEADIEKFDEARAREHDTMIRSRKIAEELGLDMKIGDVEYQGDGGKAIFYYIADERVDFRKLIRVLADTFKVRIEMKQIGARQEAGRIGGIGPCGRPLCCSTWMNRFVSVGTGAARMQDLSLNPQKLAGQCAKLKCCLNFEVDAYAESQRKLPPKDTVLETQDSSFYWFKADIMARMITYSSDKKIPANLVTISAARAFEIIALNKHGVKVESLSDSDEESAPEGFFDLVGQDDLTRFDKKKKAKKKKSGKGTQQTEPSPATKDLREKGQRQGRPKKESSDDRNPQPPRKKGIEPGSGGQQSQRPQRQGGEKKQRPQPKEKRSNQTRQNKPNQQPKDAPQSEQ